LIEKEKKINVKDLIEAERILYSMKK